MNLPVVGITYNTFDDGKIRESRRYKVSITEIVEYSKASNSLKDMLREAIKESYWLYNCTTDYFIRGIISSIDTDVIYTRTKDNRWFSLGEYGGLLDVDRTLDTDHIKGIK